MTREELARIEREEEQRAERKEEELAVRELADEMASEKTKDWMHKHVLRLEYCVLFVILTCVAYAGAMSGIPVLVLPLLIILVAIGICQALIKASFFKVIHERERARAGLDG